MTQDYKEKVLNWLVGNYNIETGNNVPEFIEKTSQITTIIDELETKFPNGYYQNGYVLCKNNNNELNGNVLVYGYYLDNNSNPKGYFILLDSQFNLLEIMTEYNSGTSFGVFQILNADESGYIYGIDTFNNVNRFIMLNNISVKNPLSATYNAILRRAYNLQGDISNATQFLFLKKSETSSDYLLIGTNNTSIPKITVLTVNVGSSNNWTDYKYDSSFSISDVYAYWNNENQLTMAIFGTKNSYDVSKLTITGEGTLGKTEIINDTRRIFFDDRNISNVHDIVIKPITETKFYIALFGATDTPNSEIIAGAQVYLYNNNTTTKVFEYVSGVYFEDSDQIAIFGKLIEVNNTYFLQYYYNLNESSTPSTRMYNSMLALITEELTNVYTVFAMTTEYSLQSFNVLAITNQYNLYNFYYLNDDYEEGNILDSVKMIYNANNYNGEAYQALNSMVSNSVNLYNSNQKVILSKNLYDRVITGNKTISILEIPNSILNDTNIQYQKLFSQTNNMMVENNDLITKNIYEEVLLNFINTITMQNQNDPDNIINNLVGATRINTSSSNILDYDATKATKYRINYKNGTTSIGNIIWTSIGNYYTTEFSVFNPANNMITSIDIISSDGNTIYVTIDTSNFEGNKKYTINQDVYIDEKVNE